MLDPVTGQQIFDLVQEIHHEFGMALVSVTHDEEMASTYGVAYRLIGGELIEGL